MEHIHGIDVSWMTHGNPKDRTTKITSRTRSFSQQVRDPPSPTPVLSTSAPSNGFFDQAPKPQSPTPTSPAQPATPVPGLARTSSGEEKKATTPPTPPAPSPPQRRGSWFSNISSKFSSSNSSNVGGAGGAASQSPPQATNAAPKPAELSVPKANPVKNAVLQHATKYEGEGPYIPAPPKTSQTGILQVFRRLSATGGGMNQNVKVAHHGLVERRVLNVDHHRERCGISGLNQSKLRRVAFCVDVEIAPMPKYTNGENGSPKLSEKGAKKKVAETSQADAAPKSPSPVEGPKVEDGESGPGGEKGPKVPAKDGVEIPKDGTKVDVQETKGSPPPEKPSDAKKKEKKKKSEEERKARKEKKRKQAEDNGTIPVEIYADSDSESSTGPNSNGSTAAPKTQAMPTTNPVRIYRRCCQLRETPILKKITEQLLNPANCSTQPGMVEKLDLTGYWMQLADLVTLGDYLAVVPVREVILENCGLTDEGVRVILAGLLAAKRPEGKRRKPYLEHGLTHQGGAVERLVLKNNKIGPEGWKHICLFVYLCRTLQSLDLSSIAFPQPPPPPPANHHGHHINGAHQPLDISTLFTKSLGERLGGSTLGQLGLSKTGLSSTQLGVIIDGVIKCGVRKLGLARNNIDAKGMEHVARFLHYDGCEGLDLGGNNLRDLLGVIGDALAEGHPLWALSLAECNLVPSSLCKLLPKLVKLGCFRFIDLSHNPDLFKSNPSAVSVLRRYLPKLPHLKRIHLADCALTSEQAIALAEILPEISELAHISFLENPELVELTNANTEEKQEEACALFASLLAATRISKCLVAVEIEVPSEQSSDLVKAMAKHVVAYCLRNMERVPLSELAAATVAQTEASSRMDPEYPDVLQHLVGHDVLESSEMDSDIEGAPDDDYVIGGTGVVKALACCLENHGDESRRQSGEFIRDLENGITHPRPKVPSGKAKETSKHLLSSARKIRLRLQPAILKAKAAPRQDTPAYHRLLFLDNTLKGIIKRFEDEFPDTRQHPQHPDSAIAMSPDSGSDKQMGTSLSSAEVELYPPALSDGEDEADLSIRSPSSPSRSNSTISTTSRVLANEEGLIFRAGQKFRSGIITKPDEHYNMLLSGVEMVAANPAHVRMLDEFLDELHDEELKKEAKEIGVVRLFKERREYLMQKMREADPEHWVRFVESQDMARANVAPAAKVVVPEQAVVEGE